MLGIGACSKALNDLGIETEIVDAVEIDKYAIASFNAIHRTNFEPQDICSWDKDFRDIDLIMHGSPCQDFSVAGMQAGGDEGSGTRSSLMYETLRIVEKIKPKYVVWENVKNILSPKHRHNFDNYLTKLEELGYTNYYKVLNAKDYLTPQNRERVFTISIRNDIKKSFKFPEPRELKLKLKDLLEENVDEKYYLSDKLIAGLIKHTERHEEKGHGFKFQTTDGEGIAKSVTTRVGACRTEDNYIKMVGKLDIKGHDCVKRVYSPEGISPTLTDMQGGNRQPKIQVLGNYMPSGHDASRIVDEEGIAPTVKENHGTVTAVVQRNINREELEFPCIGASRGRNPDNPSSRVAGDPTEQRLEINTSGTSNCLTSVQKDNYVIENEDYKIRKLTPRECWRLQGFSDEDFDKAQAVPTSNTQLYKQAGNSIVVNVLKAIFKNLL